MTKKKTIMMLPLFFIFQLILSDKTEGQTLADMYQTLKGLEEFYMSVHIFPEGIISDSMKNTLKTKAELKLRLAGVKIMEDGDWRVPNSAHLSICLCLANVLDGYSFHIRVATIQEVSLFWNPEINILGETWWRIKWGIDGKEIKRVVAGLEEIFDQFINDYLKANPK